MRAERLLICLKTYIGDAVMASPMIDTVEREFQHVTIQTSEPVRQLLQDPIKSRHFIPFEKSRKPWATIRTAMALRKDRFSTAILVNRSFRAGLIAALAGIKVRVGYGQEGRGFLLTKSLPQDDDQFEADSCMDLARALGCEGPVEPRLQVSQSEAAEGLRLVDGATIGIQPGARYLAKQIPVHVLAETVCTLQQDGHRIVLLGGPEEAEAVERLQNMLPAPAMSLVGKTDIRGTLGVLSSLRLVLGPDSGLMHVAAASGPATITAFGPTNANKWGHRYPPHRILLAPQGEMANLSAAELVSVARDALRS